MNKFRPVLAIVAAATLTLGIAAVASAQTPYDEDNPPTVNATAEVITPGSPVSAEVSGLFPGETFNWTAEFNPVFAQGTGTATDDGVGGIEFDVPDEVEGEEIVVRVTGDQTGELEPLSIEVEPTEEEVVIDEDEEEDLPRTGAEIAPFIAGGLLLVLAGGAALLLARRRNASPSGS